MTRLLLFALVLSISLWVSTLTMPWSPRWMSALLMALPTAVAKSCIYKPVTLDGYGKFGGTTVNESLSGQPLPQAVDAWLGIDFASQPVGDSRFAPATWPEPFEGIKLATEYGKTCIQDPTSTPIDTQDEACLNFNVFRTPDIPLDQKLPVLVWMHGGAFYAGSYRSFDGASFAASSAEPIVVVNFHYRINSLGFLPSVLFKEEGLENLGIRDQRLMLEFVNKHIGSFGGDPDAVTIGGRSAGAHSVGIHLFHNYADDEGSKPLFAGVIHQSGSVTSRTFPDSTYPLYKEQFDKYVSYLGCDGLEDDNAAALACLRAADIDAIRNISVSLYYDYDPTVTWPFQPVHGGPLFERPGSQSGVEKTFFKVPIISTTATDEGKYYMPGDLETNEEFLDYMHNGCPEMTEEDLSLLESLYPDPATDPSSPYVNSPNSTQYNRLSAAWSDYAYICPGQETSYRLSTAGLPTWKGRFNTNPRFPDWQGIPHTSDTRYTWNDPDLPHQEVSRFYHGYLSSFVTAGDPNTNRYPGSPEWPQYEPEGNGIESAPAKQLVVQPDEEGGTQAEDDAIRREQCLFWRDVERAPRLNK